MFKYESAVEEHIRAFDKTGNCMLSSFKDFNSLYTIIIFCGTWDQMNISMQKAIWPDRLGKYFARTCTCCGRELFKEDIVVLRAIVEEQFLKFSDYFPFLTENPKKCSVVHIFPCNTIRELRGCL